MRTTTALCWNFLLVLWIFLNSSVKKMCLSYEILVPNNYTALDGDLEVSIIDLLRVPSENITLELLEIEYLQVKEQQSRKRDVNSTVIDKLTSVVFDAVAKQVSVSSDSRVNVNNSGNDDKFVKEKFLVNAKGGKSRLPQIKVDTKWKIVDSVRISANQIGNGKIVKVVFPCGVISRGGYFGVRLTGHNQEINILKKKQRNFKFRQLENNSKIKELLTNFSVVGLDVRWPASELSISPRQVETYPNALVSALVQFLPTKCSPLKNAPPPELWLDLLFCGHSTTGCIEGSSSYRQIVYSEQIRGYPKKRTILLRCELFGSAGNFALALRSSMDTASIIETNTKDAYLKVTWSEQYIFNVHARSIFPCDVHGGGVSVLFQYPRCILKEDRIRLFSRLRADVSSLIPPTTLHYVTEQRVVKGKHSLHFDCDLFSEKYIEYCFVYVSQSITGAVSDVRIDCVPTLPVYDSDSGNWGPWNSWSTCTTTCGGGTRNRFRYCDSPPPKYGAKFCEGPSVETERCGNSDWECEFYQGYSPIEYGSGKHEFPANKPEILAEIGPGCRCGCIIHLGSAKPRRLLATSSQSCPGRIFWQIEADREHIIKFSVENFRFPCGSQWLRVRDGDSRSSTLIGELSRSHTTSIPVISSGPKLLIEFFSDELLTSGQECWGGFLAHAQQSQITYSNASSIGSGFSISNLFRSMDVVPNASTNLFLIHSFVALFIGLIVMVSSCLGIQFIFRYRKYHLTAAADDSESLTDGSHCSLLAVHNRTSSNTTLLSEIISLQRFKPNKKHKHRRLKDEDAEMEEDHSYDSQAELDKTPTTSLKTSEPKSQNSFESIHIQFKKSMSTPRCSMSNVTPDNQEMQMISKCSELNDASTSSLVIGQGNSNSENPHLNGKVRKFLERSRQSLSSSSVKSENTLTNNFDSPSSSIRSVGNAKAKKDKRNMEKLMAGSEFSLSEDGDLELDYYDYNVQNASAVPESYIGMDPAYLVWIPPFSPVEWQEAKKEKSHLELYSHDNNGANDEKRNMSLENVSAEKLEVENDVVAKDVAMESERLISKEKLCADLVKKNANRELREFANGKETKLEKSPSQSSDYYRVILDIKFADDEEDDFKIDNSKSDTRNNNGHMKS